MSADTQPVSAVDGAVDAPAPGPLVQPALVQPGLAQAAPVHRRRDVGTWLTGYATSLIGDQIFYVALTWAAIQVMSPGHVGLVLVLGSIPRMLVLLAGGAFVDRIGPKKVILVSDGLRTVVMVVAALLLSGGTTGAVVIGALAMIFGLVDGFFLPAVGAAPPFIAAASSMTRLQALRTIVYRAAPLLGAPLGSWLIITRDVSAAFWANAVLFAISVLALGVTRMVRPRDPAADVQPDNVRPEPAPSVLGEIRDGLRLMVHDRRLLVILVVVALLDLGLAGPMVAGVPLLAAERGWGPSGIGWMLGGFGAGAALTAAFLAWRRPTVRAGVVANVGLTLIALALILVGALERLMLEPGAGQLLAGAGGLLAGVGAGLFGTLINTALVTQTPINQLGRVMAAVSLAAYIGDPVSFSGTGLLTQWFGASAPFLVGGGLIAVAAVLSWSSPHVRTLSFPSPVRKA